MRLVLLFIDSILTCAGLAMLAILVTGGGAFRLGSVEVSAYGFGNLLSIALPIALLRGFLARRIPFLGVRRWDFRRVPEVAVSHCQTLRDRLSAVEPRTIRMALLAILAVSFLAKVLNAWFHYGFFSGDDVEVHETSFARIFHLEWRAWDLRSPFYPMVFIFPVQKALAALGVGTAGLVFGGRLVVIAFSLVNLGLVYALARRVFASAAIALGAAWFLAVLHVATTYASTVLPRTVAATFVLLAAWMLLRRECTRREAVVAGIALGVAASIRFGEVVFAIAAALPLAYRRRWGDLLLFGGALAVTCATILGVGDAVSRGDPFHSTRAILQYTLVERQSSRGFQPWYWYVYRVHTWCNLPFALLALASLRTRVDRMRTGPIWVWTVVPIVLLSLLPHKETRYLVAVIPFLAILISAGTWSLLETAARSDSRYRRAVAVFLSVALVAGTLYELDSSRFPRSEPAVDVARFLEAKARITNIGRVAIQQSWQAGGLLYLRQTAGVVDLDQARIRSGDTDYLEGILADPSIRYASISAKDAARCGPTLAAARFTEIPMRAAGGRAGYRLYARASPHRDSRINPGLPAVPRRAPPDPSPSIAPTPSPPPTAQSACT